MQDIKVLIVEDDPMITFLHMNLVKKRGISPAPISFKNGREALDFIGSDSSKEARYMVLLDLNMPVMNGWEFLDEISDRDVADRIKVAIVTSSVDKADKEKAKKYDVVDSYLTKPLQDFSEIREGIEQLNQQKS